MFRKISLHPADHFLALVEMDADEDAISRPICDRRAVRQRNIAVADPRHQSRETLGLEQSIDPLRDIESQIFFKNRAADGAGILAAVARIENHQGKWRGRSRVSHRSCRPRNGKDLPPHERRDHQ